MLETAKETAGDFLSGGEDDSPVTEKRGRGRPRKEQPAAPVDMQQDFTNMLAGVLALSIAATNLPPEIKPDDTELTGVSHYAIRILLRHFPLNNAMSADTLDIIGILSILSAWYMRVSPYMQKQKREPKAPGPQQQAPGPQQPDDPAPVPYSGDLGTESFLSQAMINRNGHK